MQKRTYEWTTPEVVPPKTNIFIRITKGILKILVIAVAITATVSLLLGLYLSVGGLDLTKAIAKVIESVPVISIVSFGFVCCGHLPFNKNSRVLIIRN